MGTPVTLQLIRDPQRERKATTPQSDPPSYSVYVKKELALIYFVGTFDETSSAVFDRCMAELKAKFGMAAISMKSVQRIDEAAVRPLRKFLHYIRHNHAEIKLCDLPEAVKGTLYDHSLCRPEEIAGHLSELVPIAVLRDILK